MCVKKFIFSKFASLQAYSLQHYYQINSFTGIFQQHFKAPPSMLSPCIDLSSLPSNFEEPPPPPPMFSTRVENPDAPVTVLSLITENFNSARKHGKH